MKATKRAASSTTKTKTNEANRFVYEIRPLSANEVSKSVLQFVEEESRTFEHLAH